MTIWETFIRLLLKLGSQTVHAGLLRNQEAPEKFKKHPPKLSEY